MDIMPLFCILVLTVSQANFLYTNKSPNANGPSQVQVNKYPFIVLIDMQSGEFEYFCAGVIISATWILSHKNCKYKALSNERTAVISGISKISYSQLLFEMDKLINHTTYAKNLVQNDEYGLLLIELQAPLKFSEKVGSISLPEKQEGHKHMTIKMIGWDLNKQNINAMVYPVEMQVDINPQGDSKCRENFLELQGDKNKNNVCGAGKERLCYLNGSPLVSKNENGTDILVGLKDRQAECPPKTSYNAVLFLRVLLAREWIKEVTGL